MDTDNSSLMAYLRSLASDVPVISERLNRCAQKWEPGAAPITVAFSEVGAEIADHFNEFPAVVREKIFAKIEEGMTSSDMALRTAVATGLIESLVTEANNRVELWKQLEEYLGPDSAKHAFAWRRFGS